MYCYNCGKDIPNGSNYCPNCGVKIKENPKSGLLWSRFANFYNKHTKLTISYAVWFLLHISLWIFSNPKKVGRGGHEYVISDAFYPFDKPLNEFSDSKLSFFDNIDVYDFSEFFFYVILLPLLILGLFRLYPKFRTKINMHRIIEWFKMHIPYTIAYFAWVVIQLIIYFSSPTGLFYNKKDFYPFCSSLFDDSLSFDLTDIGSYDSSELFFYTLWLPLLLVCIGLLTKFLLKSTRKSVNKCCEETTNIEKTTNNGDNESYSPQDEVLTNKISLEIPNRIDTELPDEITSELPKKIDVESKENDSLFVYLVKRAWASIIDKFIILAISFILIVFVAIINNEYIGDLGTYSALFHMTGEEVESCAIGHVMQFHQGDYISQHQTEIDDYHAYLVRLDVFITLIFVFINVAYYFISELIWKASYGKHNMGFKFVGHDTDFIYSHLLRRGIILFLLLVLMILLRWILGVNYYFIIVVYFIMLDLTVFVTRDSLVDILSRTKLSRNR